MDKQNNEADELDKLKDEQKAHYKEVPGHTLYIYCGICNTIVERNRLCSCVKYTPFKGDF